MTARLFQSTSWTTIDIFLRKIQPSATAKIFEGTQVQPSVESERQHEYESPIHHFVQQ